MFSNLFSEGNYHITHIDIAFMVEIPDDHPRAQSLRVRHAIIDGMHKKIVAEAGLIAHGRGEAFDYLIGEQTHSFALDAIRAAAAMLKLADHPVISVNGNTMVLCPESMVELSNFTQIPLEVNLFYRSEERIRAIREAFTKYDPKYLLGLDSNYYGEIDEISSQRRIVDNRGIKIADVVLVPLEDGDRTIGLKKNKKKVITIDLNPLSRTAVEADITIVDNVIRAMPLILDMFKKIDNREAEMILSKYNNKSILNRAMKEITSNFKKQIE